MAKITTILFLVAIFSGSKIYAQVNEQGADTVGRSQMDTPSIPKQKKSVAEQQLIKIKIDELPQNIVKTLQSHGYSGWTIQDAYKNIALSQYSLRLKRGNEVVFYTFDTNGERVKE
jgi:hypothetical protein